MAEYVSEEMCIIPWGDGPGELKIDKTPYDFIEYPPRDSGDGMPSNSDEPDLGFVDRLENIYIALSYDSQLKGFGKDGHLIFDFSLDRLAYNSEIRSGSLKGIFVDSLSRIYIHSEVKDHIVVTDTAGHVVNRITPYRVGSGARILNMYRNSNDVLTLDMGNGHYFGFANNDIINFASWGWLAGDKYRYYASLENSYTIRCHKYQDSNTRGLLLNSYETDLLLKDSAAAFGQFLGVDDSTNIFLLLLAEGLTDNRILVIDKSCSIVDQIMIPQTKSDVDLLISPFMSPSDGNVYEFRCLDDGLHVVRWRRI